MGTGLRIIVTGLMAIALFFGFLHLFVDNATLYNYERLHIFLFNLCGGGTILVYYSERKKTVTDRTVLFLVLSVAYAILAFKKVYFPAAVVAFILALLVDSLRVKLFSIFPADFFRSDVPVSRKFHQASLLCLSIGLVISGMVILNNESLHLVSFDKLKLDTFFLGFSFPLSLITMSVIFSHLERDAGDSLPVLKNFGFWSINLGVIIFFIFILFEKPVMQLVVTTILLLTVLMIFTLFIRLVKSLQQNNFLKSGILFLVYSAITGIAYIALEFYPDYSPEKMKFLLRMHSFASLYGWNLSGLAVICRSGDFPLRLHSGPVIAAHWLTAAVLAPLGTYHGGIAICALACYAFVLHAIMFSKGSPIRS